LNRQFAPEKNITSHPKRKGSSHRLPIHHGFFRGKLWQTVVKLQGVLYLANWATNKNRHDFPPLGCVKFPTSPMVGRMDLWREIPAGSSSPIESIPLAHEGGQWVWMATGEAPVSARTVMGNRRRTNKNS